MSEDVHLKAPGASARPAWKPRPADATSADGSAQKCAEHAAAVDASDEVPIAGAAFEVPEAHVPTCKDWSVSQALDISTAPACLSNVGSLGFGKRKDFEQGYARRLSPDAVVVLRTDAAPRPLWGATAVAVPSSGSAPASIVVLGTASSGACEHSSDVIPSTSIATTTSTWRRSTHRSWEVIQALEAPMRSAGSPYGDRSAAAVESSNSGGWQQVPSPADPSLLAALQQPWGATTFVPSAGLLLRHGGETAAATGPASGDGCKPRTAAAGDVRGDARGDARVDLSRHTASPGGCSPATSTPAHHHTASRASALAHAAPAAGSAASPGLPTPGASSAAPLESAVSDSSAASGSSLLQAHPTVAEAAALDTAAVDEPGSAAKRQRLGTGVDACGDIENGSVAAASARDSACGAGSSANASASATPAAPEAATPAPAVAAVSAPELLAFDAGGLSIWYPPVTKGKGPAPGLSGHSMSVLRDWGGAEPPAHTAAATALACGFAVGPANNHPSSSAAAASLSLASAQAGPAPAAAQHQEYVVLFGGVRGRHYLCDTFLLNPRTFRWQQVRA